LVISRTFVYGMLAAFIAGVYVAVVVGLGRLVGGGDDPNPALAIAATAVLAVSFQPLRSRLQRFANRLVFGRRFTPYEVLADFSNRVGSADEALLVEAAHSLVEGTGAESAAIWVGAWATLTRAAVWPPDVAEEPPPSPLVEEHRRVFPVEHGGRVLGALTLTPPRGQTLDGSDQRLAAELAAAMGLTLSNRELTEALRSRVAELQESRLRLVTVQDETRRRLERDLHDGAQQQLVAMKVKLALAAKVASRDGATATAAGLAELIPDVDRTVDEMREFARGIYPPLLEAEGVAAALSALVAKASILVSLQVVGLGRYRRDVESTLYFCLVEALRNVERHAGARSTHISVIDRDGWLTFEVTDDGAGFDRREGTTGTGLDNVEDRLAALDGALEVHTAHGRGTTVTGRVPVRQESLAHA
jgi:signal transduction histidine kinase